MMDCHRVPKALRIWFIIHFIADITVALPLFLFPEIVLGYFGWQNIDPLTTRLFAAALFGIGTESYLGRNSKPETYSNMLNLKIIWSIFAILGFLLSLVQGNKNGNALTWIGIFVFTFFNFLWVYWKYRLRKTKSCSNA